MGFESRAISARVTKQSVTIFSKTRDNLRLTRRNAHKSYYHTVKNGLWVDYPIITWVTCVHA